METFYVYFHTLFNHSKYILYAALYIVIHIQSPCVDQIKVVTRLPGGSIFCSFHHSFHHVRLLAYANIFLFYIMSLLRKCIGDLLM